MCGIVGMAGNLNQACNTVLRNMVLFDTTRGFDATGLALIGMNENEPTVLKNSGLLNSLVEVDEEEKWIDKKNLKVKRILKMAIGHNRAATMGSLEADNAHPFTFGNITGVHNGTLRNWDNLANIEGNDLDSRALIYSISEKGIEWTWKNFNGAAAVVWWDNSDNSLNFIRNSERPLFYVRNEANNALFWASESWIIRQAASLAKVGLSKWQEGDLEGMSAIKQVDVNHHYKYNVTSTSCKFVSKTKLETQTYSVSKPKSTKIYSGHKTGYSGPKSGGVVVKSKTKPQRYNFTNTKWAEGFVKADKDTRDMKFVLTGDQYFSNGNSKSTSAKSDSLEWFTATPIEESPPIGTFRIMTMGEAAKKALTKYANDGTVFITTARMRKHPETEEYRISSDCIRIVKEAQPVEKKVRRFH